MFEENEASWHAENYYDTVVLRDSINILLPALKHFQKLPQIPGTYAQGYEFR
jgi:hypothetical protein